MTSHKNIRLTAKVTRSPTTVEIYSIPELIDMITWLHSRQDELRILINERAPIDMRSRMTRKGDFFCGITKEGRIRARHAGKLGSDAREVD